MLIGVLFLFVFTICFILFAETELIIQKEEKTTITFKLPCFSFSLHPKKDKQKSKSIKKLPYFKLFPSIIKKLSKSKITIRKINFPVNSNDVSQNSFFELYKANAALYTLLSYISIHVDELHVCHDSICYDSRLPFCLDFSIKFKLYYIIPLLWDGLILYKKTRKKAV